jgi:hypothetical protein
MAILNGWRVYATGPYLSATFDLRLSLAPSRPGDQCDQWRAEQAFSSGVGRRGEDRSSIRFGPGGGSRRADARRELSSDHRCDRRITAQCLTRPSHDRSDLTKPPVGRATLLSTLRPVQFGLRAREHEGLEVSAVTIRGDTVFAIVISE